MGPFLGALTGTFFYDLFFFTGSESLLNRPYVLTTVSRYLSLII